MSGEQWVVPPLGEPPCVTTYLQIEHISRNGTIFIGVIVVELVSPLGIKWEQLM